jgi:hypothetical protein
MAGTAVLRIVVSNDSMKNATATSHGNNRLLDVSPPGLTARSANVMTAFGNVTEEGRLSSSA